MSGVRMSKKDEIYANVSFPNNYVDYVVPEAGKAEDGANKKSTLQEVVFMAP